MADPNGPMIRSQLLLTPALRRRLERVAQQEGRSLSDVARRALEAGLEVLESNEDTVRRRIAALDALAHLRAKVKARYGVYEGDLVAEARAERERDWERIWKNTGRSS